MVARLSHFVFCLSLIFCVSSTLPAQDVIVKRDGTEIQAKVIEVGADEIKYYRFGSTSPSYTLRKSDVFMIRYENGTRDVFEQEAAPVTQSPVKQQKVIITTEDYRQANSAAIWAYALTAPIIGLGVGAALSEDFETGIPLGATATLIAGVGIPLIAAKVRKIRDRTGVEGSPGIRTAGWVAYGIALADAGVLIGLAASDVDAGDGTVISVAILGALASTFMGIDASATANQLQSQLAFLDRVKPFYGMGTDVSGRMIQQAGIRIKL